MQRAPDTAPLITGVGTPRVIRNDWGTVAVPEIGSWTPAMTVSVIIPSFGNQHLLDLTLAGLAGQTYPSELIEVIVVEDGSEPALRLPERHPANCRLLRIPADHASWGSHNARQYGVERSTGEIVMWLDSDIVTFPDHIEAQARWQHVLPDAVTMGYKRFIDAELATSVTPDQVAAMSEVGTLDQLFPHDESVRHEWIERVFDRTDLLRTGDHLSFRLVVGATGAARRSLFDAAGGFNTALRLGGDTEFGYRLGQQGAVFVPVPESRSWHIGLTRIMQHREAVTRYLFAHLAHFMPLPGKYRRRTAGRIWQVPLVVAQMTVDASSLELTRACVDRLLSCGEDDLRVVLVADWDRLSDHRRKILEDPDLELRLIESNYAGDPRVSFRTEPITSPFPSPYLLTAEPPWAIGFSTVPDLIELADAGQHGLVRVESGSPRTEVATLWRTSAVERALRVLRPGEALADAVTEVYGACAVAAESIGVRDLSTIPGGALKAQWRHRVPAPSKEPTLSRAVRRYWRAGTRRVRRVGRRYRRAIMRRVRPTVADRRPLTPGAE